MMRPRFVLPALFAAAALGAAGVAAATKDNQTTTAAAADFTATTVSQSRTATCASADGTYQETTATYRGTATGADARLNGPLEIRAHSVMNTTTQLGWLEGTFRVRGTTGGSAGTIHAVIAGTSAVGSVVGQGYRPGAKLVASLSAAFGPAAGFTSGQVGSGSASGAGVLFVRGACHRPTHGPLTAVFHLDLRAGEVVPPVHGLDAAATGNLTLDVTRDASGTITAGTVVFYVNYRFRGGVTITGLALHQGARGQNGTVVLDAAVGTISDPDGHGNITKVVSGVSPSLLQALLSGPHGYYVDLSTAANTSGALRDQLDEPTRH